jgi:ABC-type multidrug transport system ATPase subunit
MTPDSALSTQHSALIETRSLTKAYDLLPVLRKLDLTINRGEFVALLGPNGSGKSTLIRLLAALSKPTAGTIHIGGWELPREAHAVRAQIGLVSHKPLLYDNLTARENLQFFSRLYNLTDSSARIADLLERVGLAKRGDDLVRLLHNPDVLLLDEPYTGLDQDASVTLDGLLEEAQRHGHTILMATHQLDRAVRLASRVLILSRGAVGYDAPTSAQDANELAATYTRVTSLVSAR